MCHFTFFMIILILEGAEKGDVIGFGLFYGDGVVVVAQSLKNIGYVVVS